MKYLELVCVSKEEMACFFHQMSDSRNGVIKKHAGTCITHYALHILVNPDKRGTTPGFFPSFCNRGESSVLLFSFRG